MNNNIKTIIFDLGGVLYDLDRQKCIDALVGIGVSNAGDLLTDYKQAGIFRQIEEGEISDSEFYNEIRKIAGNNVSDLEIKKAWDAFLIEIPRYKLDLLVKLKSKYQIFMLSNTNSIHFSDAIPNEFTQNGLTINDYFDRLYLSYEMKTSKPHQDIFEKLISDSGIIASEALFIDDSPENIRVANELGFKTYLARPFEDFSALFIES